MTEEKDANGNEGRSLLPEVEGEQGQVERGGDMPELNATEPKDGEETELVTIRRKKRRKERISKKEPRPPKDLIEPDPRKQIVVKDKKLIEIIGYLADKRLTRNADSNFEKTIVKRMILYKRDALDSLHDIAMFPIAPDTNPTLVHLKFLACCRLTGGSEAPGSPSDQTLPETLRRLNESYQASAARLKSVSKTVFEFEGGEEAKVIEGG